MKDEPIIKVAPKRRHGNTMNLKLIIFFLIAVGLLIAIPYKLLNEMKEEEFVLRSYEYTPVKTRTFVRNLTVAGSLQPKVAVNVEAEASGLLKEVMVKPGQDVDKGQVVAVLDLSDLENKCKEVAESIAKEEDNINELSIDGQIQRANNEKSLRDLERELEAAKTNLLLKVRLYELGSIPKKELEDAQKLVAKLEEDAKARPEEFKLLEERFQVKLDIARKNLEKYKDEYKELQANLNDATVRAPISGRVLEVKAEPGTKLTTGTAIVKLADMSSSMVVINFNEMDVYNISVDQMANIKIGGEDITGKVTYIAPQTTTLSSQGPAVEVHVNLDHIPQTARANSTATVSFEIERREDIPYLPRGPYLTSGEYSFVYVRVGDKAERRNVIFGSHDGNFVEVISGLSLGEEVIITSYEDFKEHPKVSIIPEGGRER